MAPEPISATIGAVSGIWGAKAQAKAATQSARIQAQSARESGQLQAQTAAARLKAMQEEAARLRVDTEFARKANYGQWAAGEGNEAGRFNINNRFAVGATNAAAANARNQFAATRDDRNARYTTRAGDMSNLRAMLGGQTYNPAEFDELAALERVKAEQYDPTIPDYQRNPNIPTPPARS